MLGARYVEYIHDELIAAGVGRGRSDVRKGGLPLT